MSMLCAQHLVLCVASFILAGRARREAEASAVLNESTKEQDDEEADEEELKNGAKETAEEQSDAKDSDSTDTDDDPAKA